MVRNLADKADPFTKKRLLELAVRYEAGVPAKSAPLPVPPINEKPKNTGVGERRPAPK